MSAGNALLHAANIVRALGVAEGAHVADLGAGRTGHFVFRLAEAVGEKGKVYAVDLHPEAISMLQGAAVMRLAHNVQTVWGDIERDGGVAIPAGTLDLALLVHTVSALADWEAAVREARRLVRQGGRLVVIDWLPDRHTVARMVPRPLTAWEADVLFVGSGCKKCNEFSPSRWHWGRVYNV